MSDGPAPHAAVFQLHPRYETALASAQSRRPSVKVCAQSSSPTSPATTGTTAATGATCDDQHAAVTHDLKLYSWTLAASWPAGSWGRQASHCDRSPPHSRPPASTG